MARDTNDSLKVSSASPTTTLSPRRVAVPPAVPMSAVAKAIVNVSKKQERAFVSRTAAHKDQTSDAHL